MLKNFLLGLLLVISSSLSAATDTTIPTTNTNLLFSPGGWYSNGSGIMQSNGIMPNSTYALTANPGNSIDTIVNSTTSNGFINVVLDTTCLQSIGASNLPIVQWLVDGTMTRQKLSYSATPVTITLGSKLAPGAHAVHFTFSDIQIPGTGVDNWATPAGPNFVGIKVTNLQIDGNSTLSTQNPGTLKGIWYGDSTLCAGQNLTSTSADIMQGYGYLTSSSCPMSFEKKMPPAHVAGNSETFFCRAIFCAGWRDSIEFAT